ncbi:MAG: YlbF family regulator [Acholeplasmataceae bacterium]|jgi:cell fate (sporulation/competence/biofilm development) regulator YlbF (YheA/YmcA/DUF963 family)|nr:YlbF family regulator [Acholeplasmataceae bacterium]
MTDIIIQAYQVLDEIKQDPRYQEIKKIDQYIIKHFQDEIEHFKQTKERYDGIMSQGGHYHPDFKEAVKAYSEAKSTLYSKEEVKQYFQLEKEIQDEINGFLSELSESISSFIKTPNKLGIVSKGGGSCHVG